MNQLSIFTIALDAMPFLPMQLASLNRLSCNWKWVIAEGAAMNTGSTAWCKPQARRLSRDGSTEFIASLKNHPRIEFVQKAGWRNKDEMVNAAVKRMSNPGILLQMDADELWIPSQLEGILKLFADNPAQNCARFFCRYFVGPNIITTSSNAYGNMPNEWLRAWRFVPGFEFASHEPPMLKGVQEKCISRDQSAKAGLVFDHWAYVLRSQVEFKEQFYGYKDATRHWLNLQSNPQWPVKLKSFLPWVDEKATADLLFKP